MRAMNGREIAFDPQDLVQDLHRPPAVRRDALLDLTALLFDMDVKRKPAAVSLQVERSDVFDRRRANAVGDNSETLGAAVDEVSSRSMCSQ